MLVTNYPLPRGGMWVGSTVAFAALGGGPAGFRPTHSVGVFKPTTPKGQDTPVVNEHRVR